MNWKTLCFILSAVFSTITGLGLPEKSGNDTNIFYLKSLNALTDQRIKTKDELIVEFIEEGRLASPMKDNVTYDEIARQRQFTFTDVLFDDVGLDWLYDDQANWATTYPACGGPNQSPINIRNRYLTDRLTSTCLRWQNYNIYQRGITITQLHNTVELSAVYNPVPLLSGGPLNGDYRFYSIHWHWGFDNNDGSEHAINSKKYPLELHAIHYNTRYSNIAAAVAATNDPEALVVVGVLFAISKKSTTSTNTVVNAIASAPLASDAIILNELGLGFQKDYYTYLGSLTTPPCSPIVRWVVSGNIQRIRPAQMAVFRNLRKGTVKLIDTYRELQPIGTRTVDHYNLC